MCVCMYVCTYLGGYTQIQIQLFTSRSLPYRRHPNPPKDLDNPAIRISVLAPEAQAVLERACGFGFRARNIESKATKANEVLFSDTLCAGNGDFFYPGPPGVYFSSLKLFGGSCGAEPQSLVIAIPNPLNPKP